MVSISNEEQLNEFKSRLQEVLSSFEIIKSHRLRHQLSEKMTSGDWNDDISDYEYSYEPNQIYPVIRITIFINYENGKYSRVKYETLREVFVTSGSAHGNVLEYGVDIDKFFTLLRKFLQDKKVEMVMKSESKRIN